MTGRGGLWPSVYVNAEGIARSGTSLEKFREACGIFKRVSAVSIEKATAIRPKHFDGFLRSHRPERNYLSADRLRDRFPVRPLRVERSADQGAEPWRMASGFALLLVKSGRVIAARQTGSQHPQEAPRQIHPKIAEGVGFDDAQFRESAR